MILLGPTSSTEKKKVFQKECQMILYFEISLDSLSGKLNIRFLTWVPFYDSSSIFKCKRLYPAYYQSYATSRRLDIIQIPAFEHFNNFSVQEVRSLLGHFWNYNLIL